MQVQNETKPYDTINVTPMLDLAYVLLVVFIIMTTASVQGLQMNLARRVPQQIGTAHDMADALPPVIHHHGELVGEAAIGAFEDKIANLHFDFAAGDKSPSGLGGWRKCLRHAVPASTWIDQLAVSWFG